MVEDTDTKPEDSFLLKDLALFQFQRVHLAATKAGNSEIIWSDLSVLADGMQWDSKDRI